MVAVRLSETGEQLDVQGDITYVKQVNDVADVTSAMSSYTWQMTFPKSPRNTRIFSSLGIAGSLSIIPYRKIQCQVIDNGLIIDPNGTLVITQTTKKAYIGHVKSGIIDFLSDISNDSIDDVVDLSALSHLNTPSNIINSFTDTLPYKYIVAYYNGQMLADINGITNLNNYALVPSIDVEWLWVKIFERYGWTWSGNFNFQNLWMTYPNAIGYSDDEAIQVLDVVYPEYQSNYAGEPIETPIPNTTVNVLNINNDFVIQPGSPYVFQICESGNYQIKANAEGLAYKYFPGIGITYPFAEIEWRIFISSEPEQPWNESDNDIDIPFALSSGTLVYMQVRIPGSYTYFNFTGGFLQIETRGVQTVDFSEALIKIKVKDFFKELMIRNSMTPFVDSENKHINFLTFDERINLTGNVVDWSDKYAGHTSESYVYENYAQSNQLKHKYNDEAQDYADGVLVVNNQNQPAEKTLYQSFSYAPEQELVEYHGLGWSKYYVPNLRMFDVEVQRNEDGDLIANYKNLKDRFYFVKAEQRSDYIHVSGELTDSFPLAIYCEVFADVMNTKYSQIGSIINNAKIVNIDLVLSKADVIKIDLEKIKYFKQEKAYFLLNNLTWKTGGIVTGEFVKINY